MAVEVMATGAHLERFGTVDVRVIRCGPGKRDHLESEAALPDENLEQSEHTGACPGLDPRYHSTMMYAMSPRVTVATRTRPRVPPASPFNRSSPRRVRIL